MLHAKGRLQGLRLLAAGFLLAFFSNFGQTYYIALTGGVVREEFGLSHGLFGSIYSAATLLSGLLMIWLGASADRLPFRWFTTGSVLVLVAGCVAYALAPGVVFLAVGLFALRLGGQGLLTHAAVVGMARAFSTGRGKAIAIATLGHPAGEAIFPVLVAASLPLFGWRPQWLIAAGVLVVGLLLIHFLLGQEELESSGETGPETTTATPAKRSFSRSEVLRDRRFYLLLPALIGPSFVITGIFFHQVALVEFKGWTLSAFAIAFAAFAASQVVFTLIGGVLVDRFGARRMMACYLVPLALGCLVLVGGRSLTIAWGFMILTGATVGLMMATVATMWVELYGLAHLGSIRALDSAIMVLASALAPGLMGVLMDMEVSLDAMFFVFSIWIAVAVILNLVAMRAREPTPAAA